MVTAGSAQSPFSRAKNMCSSTCGSRSPIRAATWTPRRGPPAVSASRHGIALALIRVAGAVGGGVAGSVAVGVVVAGSVVAGVVVDVMSRLAELVALRRR